MPDDQQAQLYRHFANDGSLLYVGVSISAVNRLAQHRDHAPWFTEIARVEIKPFASRSAALDAERRAVELENPKYNKQLRLKPVSLSKIELKADDAARQLVARIVTFKPLYTLQEAADVLQSSGTHRSGGRSFVKRLIASGELGSLEMPARRIGGNPRVMISGWHLIDFLEHLHRKK